MESERLASQESLPGSQTRMNNLEVGHYECLFFKCLVVVTSKSSHLLIVFIIIIISSSSLLFNLVDRVKVSQKMMPKKTENDGPNTFRKEAQ